MSGQIAQLRGEIQQRRMRIIDIDLEIAKLSNEIRNLMGSSLRANREIMFRIIAEQSAKAAVLQEERCRIEDEIDRGRRELEA